MHAELRETGALKGVPVHSDRLRSTPPEQPDGGAEQGKEKRE